MKRVLVIIVVMLLVVYYINSSGFNTYQPELVHTFTIGTTGGMLKFIDNDNELTPSSSQGPTSLTFDSRMNLYITDTRNARIVKYDNSFKFISDIKLTESPKITKLEIDSEGNYLLYYYKSIVKLNSIGEILYTFSIFETELEKKSSIKEVILIDHFAFISLNDGKLRCVDLSKNKEKGDLSFIEPETALNNSKTSRSSNHTISIKDENIYNNGDLITRSFQVFHKVKRKDDTVTRGGKSNNNVTRFGFTLEQVGDLEYIAKDKDSNTYWKLGRRRVLVLNNNGELIEALQYDMNASKIYFPAIHESGDIYFLNYDAEGVYLYRINRVW